VAKTKITKKGFKYNGMHYWRAGSQNVKLGTYGNKRSSYGVEAHNDIKATNFRGKVDVSGVYQIDWSKDSKFGAQGQVQYVGYKGGASYSREAKKGAKLKLVLMNVKKGPLQTIINKKSKGALKFFKNNKNARVVSGVWVVMEAQLADSISNSGGVSFGGTTPNGMKFSGKFDAKSKTTTSVTIPRGAIFAYMTHKASKWNKKKRKKTTIKAMKDDQVGMR